MKRLTALFILMSLFVLPAIGGWYIVQTTDNMGTMEQTIIRVQGSKMKHSEGDYDFIYDQDSKTISFVDNSKQLYWTGTAESFKTEMKKAQDAMIQRSLEKMPEAQREQYKAMLKQREQAKQQQKAESPKVEVIKTSTTETIAGYASTKYQVKVNGKLSEELWITTEVNPFKDIDFALFDKLMQSIAGVEGISEDAAYRELMEKGYVLRTKDFSNEISGIVIPSIEEVRKVEEKTLTESDFKPQAGYRKVSLSEIMLNQNQ